MRRIMAFLLSLLLSIPFSAGVNSDSLDAPSPLLIIPEGLNGHEPIEIDGNDDLNSTVITEGWGGSGTVEDPYVIKDLFIDGNGTTYCLRIINITIPLKVLNCTFMNSSYVFASLHNGSIQIINSYQVTITRIRSYNNYYGIYLTRSSFIFLDGSTFLNNTRGIDVIYSNNLTIYDCNINDSSFENIDISFSKDVFISGISARDVSRYGCQIDNSVNVTIRSSNYSESELGIRIYLSSFVKVIDCILTGNMYCIRLDNADNAYIDGIILNYGNYPYFRGFELSQSRDVVIKNVKSNGRDNLFIINSCSIVAISDVQSITSQRSIMVQWSEDVTISNANSISSEGEGILVINSKRISITDSIFMSRYRTLTLSGCEDVTFGRSHLSSNLEICVIIEYNVGPVRFEDLTIESLNYPSFTFYSILNNIHFSNISITGQGMNIKDLFYNLLYPQYQGYLNNSFRNISLNDRPLHISWNEDLGGRTLTGNFSQIILFNSTNAIFNGHSLMNSISGVTAYDISNISFLNMTTSENDKYGFFLIHSRNIRIRNSESLDNVGIEQYFSDNVSITGNKFKENWKSIYSSYSNNIHVEDNKFDHSGYIGFLGQQIMYSTNHSSKRNVYTGPGHAAIQISRSEVTFIEESIETLDYGILAFDDSKMDIEGSSFSNIKFSAIDISDTTSGQNVSDCSFMDCQIGIHCVQTSYVNIVDSSFDYCETGVSFYTSTNLTIADSIFYGNDKGIALSSSDGGFISGSLFLGNYNHGIESINSRSFIVWNNSFIWNNGITDTPDPERQQCHDNSKKNTWYNRELFSGNHWSELTSPDADLNKIVDMSYKIESGGDWSKYPLVFSPVDLISPPMNLTATANTNNVYLIWEKPQLEYHGKTIGYKIYRGASPDRMEEIWSQPGQLTEFTDLTPTPGILYFYLVRAYCSFGIGTPSNIVEAISDVTPPVITITSPSMGKGFNVRDVLVQWIAEDPESNIDEFLLSLDGGSSLHLKNDSMLLLEGLNEGLHRVTIIAINDKDLESSANVSFIIDVSKPDLWLSEEGPIYSSDQMVDISWTSDDSITGVYGYSYRIDDGIWHSNGMSETLRTYLVEGQHNVTISCFDMVGNTVEVNAVIFVDITEPEVEITSPEPGSYLNFKNISLTLDLNDELSGIFFLEYDIDSTGEVKVQAAVELILPYLAEGPHEVVVRLFDRCLNSAETSINFIIDRTSPNIGDFGPQGTAVHLNSNVFIVFNETIDYSDFRFSIDMNGTSSWDGNRFIFNPYIDMTPGNMYQVEVHVKDLAGNGPISRRWYFTTTDRGTVIGHVIDRNGIPISGLQVEVDGEPITQTDGYGHFSMDVQMGERKITISGPSITKIDVEVFVMADSTSDLGVLEPKNPSNDNRIQMGTLLIGSVIVLIIMLLAILVIVIKKRRDSRFVFFIDDERPHKGGSGDDDQFEEFWIDLGGEVLTDHYQVIGVPRSSNQQELKKAYRMMAGKYHPDRALIGGEMGEEELSDMMALLNEAKEVLLNPVRRNMYDAWLHDRELEM